jgi:hypothetical protein
VKVWLFWQTSSFLSFLTCRHIERRRRRNVSGRGDPPYLVQGRSSSQVRQVHVTCMADARRKREEGKGECEIGLGLGKNIVRSKCRTQLHNPVLVSYVAANPSIYPKTLKQTQNIDKHVLGVPTQYYASSL